MLTYFVFQVDVVACPKISIRQGQNSAEIQNHRPSSERNCRQLLVRSGKKAIMEIISTSIYMCRFKCLMEMIVIIAPLASIKSQYGFLCYFHFVNIDIYNCQVSHV